ncbi:hypothetical protein J5N97_020418 [Dioscorea zingiberensis]|uniref:ABC-2 type transporter transmembrane domain-containing protein n=1 Tax=Dioscorea zingiberensis TaxID=325984 RepID=A0A9D5CGD8_9LILI|nr:hypothetical protein J5N97_020418 [Dioscorea zingiberensis]
MFYICADALPVFLQECYIFMRETVYDAYHRSSYILSNAIAGLPSLLFLSITFVATTFFVVSLASNFFFFLIIFSSSVHQFTLLMDDRHDHDAAGLCDALEDLDNHEGKDGVEPEGGLIKEEDDGVMDDVDADGDAARSPLLTPLLPLLPMMVFATQRRSS